MSCVSRVSFFWLFSAELEFDKVVFLYHLERGQAAASYGLNVASLAGLPATLLHSAHTRSKGLEEEVTRKISRNTTTSELTALLAVLNQPNSSVARVLRDYALHTPLL